MAEAPAAAATPAADNLLVATGIPVLDRTAAFATVKPHRTTTLPDALRDSLPGVEVVRDWRGPDHMENQRARVMDFLARHTPR